jgi:hypothetical protein
MTVAPVPADPNPNPVPAGPPLRCAALLMQDLLLAFVDCVERHGAKLAAPRTVVS